MMMSLKKYGLLTLCYSRCISFGLAFSVYETGDKIIELEGKETQTGKVVNHSGRNYSEFGKTSALNILLFFVSKL